MSTPITLLLDVVLVGGFLLGLTALLLAWQIVRCYAFRRWSTRVRLPSLVAYLSDPSVAMGEAAKICVHSTRPAQARLLRLGERSVETGWQSQLPACVQSGKYDFWKGFSWRPQLSIDTSSLESGLYLLELEHREDASVRFRLPIIVKPIRQVDVAVICSTNTWQAYNPFGGLSNYYDRGTPLPLRALKTLMTVLNLRFTLGDRRYVPAVPLPLARPNSVLDEDLRDLEASPIESFSHLARAEWALLRFLERACVEYGVFSDHDLAYDPWPTQAKLLLFNVHSEYWSEEMQGRLTSYLDGGGKAAFLSGNNIYRMVELVEGAVVVRDFKADRASVSRLLGASYNAWGYLTYAGYQVIDAKHWVFAGTDVKRGDTFAEKQLASPTGTPQLFGASGYETDKITKESADVEVLAIGKNREGPAYMVFRETAGGGWVFNSASVASAPWVNEDPVFAAIVRNLIDRALQVQTPAQTPHLRVPLHTRPTSLGAAVN